MKKVLFIAIVGLLGFGNMNAQTSFSHALGGKLFLTPSQNLNVGGIMIETEATTSIGILYSPRFNFVELDNATISVGTHFGLAFQGEFNSREGSSSSFVYDLPLVVEYNYGFGSDNNNNEDFGFYVGGGYGVHSSGGSDQASSSISGFVASAGARFLIFERPIDLNFSYLKGTGDSKDASVIGVGVQYMFGI